MWVGGTINIRTIYDLVPLCVKHVSRYRSHSVPCAGFEALKVIDLKLVDNFLHINTQEKLQWG
jgi:hypothetical protein